MKKRILAMLLALLMLLSVATVCAEGETNIDVFLSMSRYGEIIEGKNGESMSYVTVSLSGKSSYNLDDVFLEAHRMYYEDGEAGYASSVSEWGFGIDKLWGDESGRFGYQVNSGTESVMGLGHEVSDGDCVDAFIYKNAYPDTEGYAMFNKTHTVKYTGIPFELVLKYFSGYDENWNTIISPCDGAIITINGEETELITDENGTAEILLENEEIHIISATKSKILGEAEVPAITAPVCIVDVKNPKTEIVHNIAKKYSQADYSQQDVNLAWVVSDMLMYEELFEDSENILTESQKETAFKAIAASVSSAEKPGDLAKYIIALRALGYDAKTVYTEDFKHIDAVKKLTDLVDSDDEAVTNIYTLPYVLIALMQDDEYANQEQFEKLIVAAIESKASWQSTEYGTDALTPMILALAPFADANDKISTVLSSEVSAVLSETIEILKEEQREDGLIDGFEGYEPASTGLAICALSAAGIDADTVKKSENSLIWGLISVANEDLDGFANAFATEQGFRGLIAWRLLAENKGKNMYDFSDYPKSEANVPGIENCPVIFNVSPQNAEVTIDGKEEFSKNCFDLDAGEYTYNVYSSGYTPQTGVVTITEDEAQNRTAKTINVSLDRIYYGGVSSQVNSNDNEEKETETIVEPTKPLPQEEKQVFSETTFKDVNNNDWYYGAVKYVYEKNLFKGTDSGFEPDTSMTRAMLVTVLHRLDAPEKISLSGGFRDVAENVWYSEGVNWASEHKIINGVSDNDFAPETSITREQIAVILYRYATYKGYDISAKNTDNISSFDDKDKISSYASDALNYIIEKGVLNGRGGNIIAPTEKVTRAEVAAMLMRFAELEG